MAKQVADRIIIEDLQRKILNLQSKRLNKEHSSSLGLGLIESAFPDKIFPVAAVHELISYTSEDAGCTSAFISVVLGKLIKNERYCIWISQEPRRSVFPPAIKCFGINPEKILFVDVAKARETLWVIEEAMKCNALVAVIGEISELSFQDSRRLQLAVEKSSVTAFIHRFRPRAENATACLTRWKIKSLASEAIDGLPGLGFPRWDVNLLKIRNAKPASWQIQYSPTGIEYIQTPIQSIPHIYKKQSA